jgi:hypothetical protein
MAAQYFEIPNFDHASVARLTNAHRLVMARVVLSFARLDTQLSNWLVEGYDMRVDRAALLLQNMTITNKYMKLAKLYEHEGPASLAQQLRRSKKQMEPHAETRNTICHAACFGTWAADRDYILFAPLSYTPGELNRARVEAIPVQSMEAAAEWAENQAGSIVHLLAEPPRRRSRS